MGSKVGGICGVRFYIMVRSSPYAHSVNIRAQRRNQIYYEHRLFLTLPTHKIKSANIKLKFRYVCTYMWIFNSFSEVFGLAPFYVVMAFHVNCRVAIMYTSLQNRYFTKYLADKLRTSRHKIKYIIFSNT
jgi:hypothetical protein